MKAKTEELLYLLLWYADLFAHPTFRNWTDSYEAWAYRNGFLQQMNALEKRHLLEREPTPSKDRLYRLTEQGRLQALGGRNPEAQWSRTWDGHWRLVVFDVPIGQNARREKLWRYLRNRGFGCLQKSVWITPDPLEGERKILAGSNIDVSSLILLEARPCAEETDSQIVAGAWNFELIDHRYADYLKVLEQRPAGALQDELAANAFRTWTIQERSAWLEAISLDPLLPERLLPQAYLGREAWRRRLDVLREAGQQLRTFENRTDKVLHM